MLNKEPWNARLTWKHPGAMLVFILVGQTFAAISHQAPPPPPVFNLQPDAAGTSLYQRLMSEARQGHLRVYWVADDPAARSPALSPAVAHHGTIAEILAKTIAEERLTADAQHKPMPEVEACFEGNSIVLVRDVDLYQPCAAKE